MSGVPSSNDARLAGLADCVFSLMHKREVANTRGETLEAERITVEILKITCPLMKSRELGKLTLLIDERQEQENALKREQFIKDRAVALILSGCSKSDALAMARSEMS